LLEEESIKIHPSDLSTELPLLGSYTHNIQTLNFPDEYNICISPPFIEKPSRSKLPFLTLQCGTLAYPPTDLDVHFHHNQSHSSQTVEHYCAGGPNDKLPNIDINLESQQVKSWTSAKHMLQDAHENKGKKAFILHVLIVKLPIGVHSIFQSI
jgi:hypothetical protein